MKKYLILAAAVLVASAACTKSEVINSADQKISFEVANYMAQTKANQDTNAELGGSFTTNAWFTNGDGVKMQFMNDVAITWNTPVSGQWAPARDYYWPKTGYIDFYSYDGTLAPTTKAEGSLVYTNATITSTDNILVADAAYRQTGNSSTYHIDASTVVGVPTLFRHQLAKVKFTVKLATTDAKKSANTKWDVTILNETGHLSNLIVHNAGTLTLSNSYSGTAATTQAWTNANTSNPNVGWVAGTSTETISTLTPALVLPKNATSSGDPVDLIALRAVMPQVLGNDVVFTLNYNVKATYGDETTAYLDENRSISKKLTELVAESTPISEWDMNKIITYNVIIDPVSERILFDPAVEEWVNETAQTINIPE